MNAHVIISQLWEELSRQGFHEVASQLDSAERDRTEVRLPPNVRVPSFIHNLVEKANWCLLHGC